MLVNFISTAIPALRKLTRAAPTQVAMTLADGFCQARIEMISPRSVEPAVDFEHERVANDDARDFHGYCPMRSCMPLSSRRNSRASRRTSSGTDHGSLTRRGP